MTRYCVNKRLLNRAGTIPAYMLRDAPMVGLNAELETHIDRMSGDMVVALHTWVLECEGKKESREVEFISYPLTWWDHFKSRYFEEWAHFNRWHTRRLFKWVLARWPIRYKTTPTKIETTEYRLCPHCTEDWSIQKEQHLEWLVRKESAALPTRAKIK